MATIMLPQAGKNMQSATIRRWRKKPGEAINKGDVLLEVETEEGLVEIEAGGSGTLANILIPAGKTIGVNTAIAVIGESGASPTPAQSVSHSSTSTKGNGSKPMATTPTGKVTPIVMPKAGQSMEEGVLVKWHKKPGDMIKQGEVIFEIETDKATMDVEATDSGRLAKIVLGEGGNCKVMEPVAYLADNDADADAFIAAAGGAAPAVASSSDAAASVVAQAATSPAAPVATTDSGRVKASPAARRVAAERGVDLGSVGAGSGPGGRILSTDVPVAAARAATPVPAAAPARAPVTTGEGIVRKRMTPMRKAIAGNLSISKQTIPHFYIKLTIDAQPLFDFYQGEKAKYPCSINDVVIMAAAKLIMEFALFRSRIEGEEIVTFPSANVGVAVGLEEGLVVPVVVGAEKLTLKQIGAESKRITTAAKAGKIEGMNKGLFTISNMGMYGVEEFAAIINPPESAILAVGTIREQVIVSGGTMRPGKVMTLTLSVDHRVVDGSLAAKFLARMKELLEWPGQMV